MRLAETAYSVIQVCTDTLFLLMHATTGAGQVIETLYLVIRKLKCPNEGIR